MRECSYLRGDRAGLFSKFLTIGYGTDSPAAKKGSIIGGGRCGGSRPKEVVVASVLRTLQVQPLLGYTMGAGDHIDIGDGCPPGRVLVGGIGPDTHPPIESDLVAASAPHGCVCFLAEPVQAACG